VRCRVSTRSHWPHAVVGNFGKDVARLERASGALQALEPVSRWPLAGYILKSGRSKWQSDLKNDIKTVGKVADAKNVEFFEMTVVMTDKELFGQEDRADWTPLPTS